MRSFIRASCLSVCLLLVSVPVAFGNGGEGAVAASAKVTARTEIWKDINAGGTGSAAVAIMDNGKIVYSEGFGMADRENSVPVDKNTIFNIGSVSKVYVATAIMLLVDDGKVDLDMPVTHYLPEFSMADERYKGITVRMTLNHSSGLPGTSAANNFGYEYNKDVYKDTMATLAQSTLKHRPGEMAPYCNDGFTLAEMIVVRVSGQSFMDFMAARVFKPLSLKNTGPSVGQRQTAKGIKTAKYYPPGKLAAEPPEVLSVQGAGGLSATAEDLCRFADVFSGKGGKLFSAKALEEITQDQPAAFRGKLRAADISYGLGWDVTDHERYKEKGFKVLGKSGGTGTYTAQVFTVPDKRIAVAVIATGKASAACDIADSVLAAYLADKGLMKPTAKVITPPVKAQPVPAELKVFEGYYSNGNTLMRIAFDMAKGTVTGYKAEGAKETPLIEYVYNDGYFHKGGNKVYFTAFEGRRYLVQHVPSFKADTISMEKLVPVAAPTQMAAPVDGKQWLRRNAKAFEGAMGVAEHVVESGLLSALPGYIDFVGIKKVESPTFAGMPVKATRDQSELRLVEKDGRMWAWVSGMVFMPADLAKGLASGTTTQTIGPDGYNEWLKVAEDCVLSFAKPDKGRVIVFAADGAALYDSATDSGEVFAAGGSFVEIAGNAGDVFKVTALVKQD